MSAACRCSILSALSSNRRHPVKPTWLPPFEAGGRALGRFVLVNRAFRCNMMAGIIMASAQMRVETQWKVNK